MIPKVSKNVGQRCAYLFLHVATLWCATTPAGADVWDDVKQRGAFIWGADEEGGGPYVYPDPKDPSKLLGFEVELAEMLAEELSQAMGAPIKAQFKAGPWSDLPLLVDQGTIVVVLNGYDLIPQRQRDYLCTRPYYLYGLQLMARRDSEISSWADLKTPASGKVYRVGVLQPSAAEKYVDDQNALYQRTHGELGAHVLSVPYPGNTNAMDHVQDGVLDVTLQDDCIAIFYADRYPQLKFVERPVGAGYYVMMIKKGEDRFFKEMDEALGRIISNGRLKQLYDRWDLSGRSQMLALRHVSEMETAPESSMSEIVQNNFWSLLQAAGMTVFLSVVSMPIAIFIGIAVAVGRLYGPWYLSKPLGIYIEVLRGTPLMLQLFAIFYLLPKIGIVIHPIIAAIAGLAVNYSAYEAEIYRAGLQAIPHGQMEAALSLGMSKFQAIWRIILPQAVRIVIPPVTNDFIALFKDTSVCSVVTVVELTKQYSILALSTGAVVQMAALTGILYMLMSYPLALFVNWNERRMQGVASHH